MRHIYSLLHNQLMMITRFWIVKKFKSNVWDYLAQIFYDRKTHICIINRGINKGAHLSLAHLQLYIIYSCAWNNQNSKFIKYVSNIYLFLSVGFPSKFTYPLPCVITRWEKEEEKKIRCYSFQSCYWYWSSYELWISDE